MTIKQIKQQVNEGEDLLSLTQAYTEISSMKLKKIRDSVRYSRAFFDEISQIFFLVKYMAAKRAPELPSKTTISIALTSNEPFYGHITKQTIEFFMDQTNRFPTERVIIGKSGQDFLTAQKFKLPYQQLILNSDIPDAEELSQLVSEIRPYHQILVFYSEYQSLIRQVPVIKDITQSQSQALRQAASQMSEHLFIFEPEVDKMLDFFEGQIKTALLQQTFLEAELARVASKLVVMDQAQNNAKKFLDGQSLLLNQAKRSTENRKLLETWASILQFNSRPSPL